LLCFDGCGIDAAVSLCYRIGGINAEASLLEDDNKDDEGRLKELGGRICCLGQKTGAWWYTVVSIVGRWQRRTWQGGSAPNNGTKVVGVGPVSSSTTKWTVALLVTSWPCPHCFFGLLRREEEFGG
jgi:hypothetical protein